MSEMSTIQSEIRSCTKCARLMINNRMIQGADHHPIIPSGSDSARILIVGQAPGRMKPQDASTTERPFAQGSGDMLDVCLTHVGLSRNDVFIANILQCHTPEDKTFTDVEVANCKPFLLRIIQILQPQVIIALGKFAALQLGGDANMKDGDSKTLRNGIKLLYLYHPAYVQRNMSYKQTYLKNWNNLNTLLTTKSSLKTLMGE